MPAPQVFKVLTEFKFEVGGAVLGAGKLQNAVDGVSQSAENLQFQLARIGFGFAAQLGLVGGGALGIMSQMISQFNKIEKQQIKIGGIFFANKGFLSGIETANDALQQSDKFLREVSKQANKFGLNENALAQFAALGVGITAKEGISPQKNIEFGRNILKAAPQLGINPQDAQGQITRSLLGGASLGDPAFRAVAVETTAFQEFAKKVGGINKVTKEFNKLKIDQRFKLLNKAFGQFTQNLELLDSQANTIPSLLTTIRQELFGFDGALRPIAETLGGIIKEALQVFLDALRGPLRSAFMDVGIIIKLLAPDLQTLVLRLNDVRSAAKNLNLALKVTSFLLLLPLFIKLGLILSRFGVFVGILSAIGRGVLFVVAGLGKLGLIFKFIGGAILSFLPPLLLIFTVFQLLSRARAIAKIADLKAMPAIIARFAKAAKLAGIIFGFITAPFRFLFNEIAKGISPLFKFSTLLSGAVSIFEFLTDLFFRFFAALSGLVNAILVPVLNLLSGNFKDALSSLSSDNLIKNFQEGAESFFRTIAQQAGDLDSKGLPVSEPKIDIGKIEIKNNFKQQQQPDRIAFTLKDQLLKAAQNPTQAARGGLNFASGGGVR